MELVAQTGYCAHPVRLRGRVEHGDAETGDEIGETDFTVQGADPHGFDGDNDGVGCES